MTIVTSGPNLAWLDEELRKEKALVEELRNLLDKQQVMLVDQTQRIISLEDRLTKLQGQLGRIADIEEALQHTRDEIVLMVSEMKQDFQKRETESLRLRQAEREKDQKTIQEILLALERIAPLEQALAVRQAEDTRLNEAILRLQQEVQALAKVPSAVDEWRRQLADGIAKNTVDVRKVEEEMGDLRKAQQESASRLVLVNEALAKVERAIAELQAMRQEITAQQEQMAERQRREDRSRAQTMTEWGRRLDGFAHQMEAWADQLRLFADQHEKNRRLLRDIQSLAQEVSQQQDRLQQLQRLAEEQLRREMREMRGENDRRWAQEMERREQILAAQAQRDDAQDLRLTDLEQGREDHAAALANLEERLAALRADMEALAARQQRFHRQSLQAFQKQMEAFLAQVSADIGSEE